MSIQFLINESLRKEQEKKREPSDKFKPHLLGRCYRAQIWAKANEPQTNPPDERALRIFKCGHLFHDFVQGFLPPSQVEVKCEDDMFKGRTDIVTDDTVYDVKSVHSFSFHYSNKPDYDVRKEKYHNWLQLTFYADHLKKLKMVLVNISKDDMCINEYVEFTSKWKDDLIVEKACLNTAWSEYPDLKPNALPRFNKECKYCSYLDKCKEIETNGNRQHPLDKRIQKKVAKRK